MRRSFARTAPAVLVAFVVFLAACGGAKEPAPAAEGRDAAPGGAPEAEPVQLPPDTVIAEVNGRPIKSRRLLQEIEMTKMRMRAQGRAVQPDAEVALRQAALEAFIANELIRQDAEKTGIQASEEEIAQELQGARTGFPDEQAFRKFLAEAQLTDADLRNEATLRVITRKYMKSVAGNAAVPEAEVKKFYDANPEMFREPEKVRAQIVVVLSKPDDAEPLKADARKRIEEARKRALAGEDFAAIAKEYSQVPNAGNGGDLGWFHRGETANPVFPRIEDLGFSTPVGQITPIFDTPTGLNFMKITEKQPARVLPFDDVKARLALDMGRAKDAAAVQQKVQQLSQAAQVKIVDEAFLKPAVPAAAPTGAAPGGTQPPPAAK
ncbi:MAG TPA: peptidyl-prolyl cis-trans isomerase [Candidatus Polarisedimenticolaceae bacterium]